MKTTFGVLCAILAAHCVAAQCNLKTYTTQLQPACDVNDIYVKWPNYGNISSYYTCFGVGNPVLTPCPSGEYFSYVYQQCNYCNQYIPAPPCENLKTQNPPKCVPIGTGGGTTAQTYPTPYYPTTVATKPPVTKRPTKAPVTKAPVTKAPVTKAPPTAAPTPPSGVPTPPSVPGTPYPGPPTPVTNNPDIPVPQTPEPTPPSIAITPPTA